MAVPDVFAYSKCTTCRKALKWLDDRAVKYRLCDIVGDPPSAQELGRVLAVTKLPVKKLFNTTGLSYRQGGYAERLRSMSDDEALAALAADGKLIKRPLVIGPGWSLVGFDAVAFRERFGG